jgi:hypothetical protein
MHRNAALAAAIMAVLSCVCSPKPDRVLDIPVTDAAKWTCSALCTYDGSSQTHDYVTSEPAIVWGFTPPDIHGDWERSKGFAAFSLAAVAFSPGNSGDAINNYLRRQKSRHVPVSCASGENPEPVTGLDAGELAISD